MITTRMTRQEIVDELMTDITNVIKKCYHKEGKVNKLADRAALFPFKAHTEFGTPMKNNWMIVWYVLTKKSPVIMKTMICIVETDNGKMAYTRDNSQDKMLSFSPHFFSRYAERAGVNLTGTALIKHFFLNNLKFEYMGRLIPDEDGNTQKTEVYIRCDSGVGIGVVYESMFEIRTFITYDMLKGKQVEAFTADYQDLIIKYMKGLAKEPE